jgi:putative sterol carrier protein
MTFEEKFNELKDKYAPGADFRAVDYDLAAEITLTDADCGGTFYIAWLGGKLQIAPYNYNDATVRVSVGSDLLERLLQGKENAVKAFLRGDLDAEGDPAHALALIEAMKRKKKR